MTKEQIVKKMIKKAVKGGWKDFDGKGSYLDKDISGVIIGMHHIEKITFSHEFAKAYWGEEEVCLDCGEKGKWGFTNNGARVYKCECNIWDVQPPLQTAWQYYQHKMLDYLQEGKEPLEYIGKFLDKEVK